MNIPDSAAGSSVDQINRPAKEVTKRSAAAELQNPGIKHCGLPL